VCTCPHNVSFENVYSGFIHNSVRLETTQTLLNERMDKEILVCVMLCGSKKKELLMRARARTSLRSIMSRKKSEERAILCDSSDTK